MSEIESSPNQENAHLSINQIPFNRITKWEQQTAPATLGNYIYPLSLPANDRNLWEK